MKGGVQTRRDDITTEAGRIVTVTRHPAAGREIEAFGGARLFGRKSVIDIGTGDGRLAFDAAVHARRVLGIDPNAAGIAAAARRAEENGNGNMAFRVGDARTLDVARERFDVAILSWSL